MLTWNKAISIYIMWKFHHHSPYSSWGEISLPLLIPLTHVKSHSISIYILLIIPEFQWGPQRLGGANGTVQWQHLRAVQDLQIRLVWAGMSETAVFCAHDDRTIKYIYIYILYYILYIILYIYICMYVYIYILVGGIPTPLKNMKVNGKDDIPYIM